MRLNSEMRMLLDKLYNLRGEDSVVLVSMDKERDQAIKTKERTSKRTTELTSQIEKLESEGHILAKEGESFKSALETIRKDDFINVLKELNIAFDPEEIKKELEVKLPKTLEEFSMEKEKAEKELVTVEDEMNSATTKIEELGLRKDEALANQERLNRYFELALEGNINITRDEITSLLEKFNFSEEEQREAAKLLMFPEDGLYEYEKSLKGIKSKSISDVFKEAKEEIKTEEINKETPVVEAPLHEEEPSFNFDFNINIPENKEVKEEQIEAIVEPVKEEDKTVSKEDVISLLTSLGFDYLDFTSNDFEKIMNNYDEETIKANAEYIKLIKILTNESLRKRAYAYIIAKIGNALVSSNIEQHVFHSIYYAPGNLSRDGQRIDFVFNPGDKAIRKGPNTRIIDLTADYYKALEYKKSLQTK